MKHTTYPYILYPQHEITVNLIGVGGTGSQVLNILARMHIALKALGHPGFAVTAFDGDTISEANVGRQSFWAADIGQNKASNLITKINLAFGLNWTAIGEPLTQKIIKGDSPTSNILITCTDTIKSRLLAQKFQTNPNEENLVPYRKSYYWLDFGNSAQKGQVILSTPDGELKDLFHLFPEMEKQKESNEPSCSMIEALTKQDLLINSTLSNLGMHLLWKLFRECTIDNQGVFLNLNDFSISKIPICN